MENCVKCGASTSLYVKGRPVCPKCDGSGPQEREKRSEQRVLDIREPGVRELALYRLGRLYSAT